MRAFSRPSHAMSAKINSCSISLISDSVTVCRRTSRDCAGNATTVGAVIRLLKRVAAQLPPGAQHELRRLFCRQIRRQGFFTDEKECALRRGLELPGEVLGTTAGMHQLDQLLPQFRRIRRATAGHGEPPSIPTLKSVHESGSSPEGSNVTQ